MASKSKILDRLVKDEAHAKVIDQCAKELGQHGSFRISEVLKKLGMQALARAIVWSHVKASLEAMLDCELVAVVDRYFEKRRWPIGPDGKVLTPEHAPAKFTAGGGHGKLAAGFVGPHQDHAPIYRYSLGLRDHLAEGWVGRAASFRLQCEKHGLLPIQPQLALGAGP